MTTDELLDEIVRREGGFVNNPDDPGRATNFGITQATLSDFLGRPASIDDVRNLSVDTAKSIFRTRYISRPGIDQLPTTLEPVVADMSVNAGPVEAIKLLQAVVNQAGYGPVDQDGELGGQTLQAVTTALATMQGALINAYCDARIGFYRQLASNNPQFREFISGWIARANSWRVAV